MKQKAKRDLIQEIVRKSEQVHKRGTRRDIVARRVRPLVFGYRMLRQLPKTKWRDEWLKYGPIGYVACVEGYVRLVCRDLIDRNESCRSNVADLKYQVDLAVLAKMQKTSTTIGEFVAHKISVNGVSDIDAQLSKIMGQPFLKLIASSRVSDRQPKTSSELFPNMVGRVQRLFELRHQYAHEIGTKKAVRVRHIDQSMESAALFIAIADYALVSQGYLDT